MHKGLGVVVALAGAILCGCATAEIREGRVVRGRIVDDAGRPVADTPVTVVGETLSFEAARMGYRVEGRRDLVARTDVQGQYRIEFTPADLGNNIYLFFYGAEGFDAVRYRKSEGLNLTDQLKTQRELRFDQVLRPNPDWPEVQRLMAEYGADSPRGQVLRTHGLPEKREPFTLEGQAGETWWYYALGVSYRFVGATLQGRSAFEPATGKPQ
jgi:hypothetical protein